jgi:hypothetical protein
VPVDGEVVSAARRYSTTPVLAVCAVATIVDRSRASYCSRLISGYAVTPLKLAMSASRGFGSSAMTPAIAPVIVPTAAASASTRRGVVDSSLPMRSLRRLAALRGASEDPGSEDCDPRRDRDLLAFLCDVMLASPPRSEQTTKSELNQVIGKVPASRLASLRLTHYLESAPFATGEILHIDGGQAAGH